MQSKGCVHGSNHMMQEHCDVHSSTYINTLCMLNVFILAHIDTHTARRCLIVCNTVNILKIRKSKVRKLAAILPRHALKIRFIGRL